MAVARGAKKSNATTEVVIGQAAQQINKAVAELKNAFTQVEGLESKLETLSLQVTGKEERIAELDAHFAEQLRQKEVELELQFKQNQELVVNKHLLDSGKTAILKTEYNQLIKELEVAKKDNQEVVSEAVSAERVKLVNEHSAAIKLIEAEHKSTTIENTAKISSLEEKNTFLQGQVYKLYEQLDSERSASIERAKAGSVGTINVNGASK